MTISTVKLIIDRPLIQPITSDDEYEELKDLFKSCTILHKEINDHEILIREQKCVLDSVVMNNLMFNSVIGEQTMTFGYLGEDVMMSLVIA